MLNPAGSRQTGVDIDMTATPSGNCFALIVAAVAGGVRRPCRTPGAARLPLVTQLLDPERKARVALRRADRAEDEGAVLGLGDFRQHDAAQVRFEGEGIAV